MYRPLNEQAAEVGGGSIKEFLTMQYTPKQEREIRDAMVLDPGTYDFEVADAQEKVSKKNNDMIELTLRIFPKDGSSPRLLKDWLVPGSDMGDLKLNRFAHAVSLQDAYFEGSLTGFACQGAAGKLQLTVDSSETYGTQNRVKGYIVGKDETAQAPEIIGVPTTQTRRANRRAKDAEPANDELAQEYEKELAAGGDGIPF